jgi:TPR repeat protein
VFKSVTISIALALVVALPAMAQNSDQYLRGADAFRKGNYSAALREVRPLAKKGHPAAQTLLGMMYSNGQGVSKNYKEAVKWFREAAKQGNGEAKYSLGVIYDQGIGVPKDYSQATKWFRQAAELGHPDALFNLGNMYAIGNGVPKDSVQAYMWINLAALYSPPGALKDESIQLLGVLSKSMTQTQGTEAHRLVREWWAKHKKK